MKQNRIRQEFKNIHKIDAIQKTSSIGELTYYLDYVHFIEDKLLSQWNDVNSILPDNEITVLCYHEYSGNYFICYRTLDCLTLEHKWFGGSMPTHWKYLDKPL